MPIDMDENTNGDFTMRLHSFSILLQEIIHQRSRPLVTVSLGIVHCTGQTNLKAISERAAEVKTYAKSMPGCSYVVDRRPPLGQDS